jgi:hypothetical protein
MFRSYVEGMLMDWDNRRMTLLRRERDRLSIQTDDQEGQNRIAAS